MVQDRFVSGHAFTGAGGASYLMRLQALGLSMMEILLAQSMHAAVDAHFISPPGNNPT
jgi:hypothetical protein